MQTGKTTAEDSSRQGVCGHLKEMPMGESRQLFLLGRAGVMFFELDLGDSTFAPVC